MGTVIRLYYCRKCGAIMDEAETTRPKPCPNCECRMLGLASPTVWNKLRYLRRHPRLVWVWVKENVFKRGC